MGEGDGKKDVTDQIEDEEQLLGLKGDEPDKDQAEEAKELGWLFLCVCRTPVRTCFLGMNESEVVLLAKNKIK